MKVKTVLGCSVIAFAAVLGIVVGNRMSAEAMAVVIGVVCGVAASIPMSAIILALSRARRPDVREETPAVHPTPPVFVVTPGAPGRPVTPWADYAAPSMPAPREYRVIGEERLA